MKCTTGGILGDAIMNEVRKGTNIQEGLSESHMSSDDIMNDVERILVNGAVMIGVKLLSSLLRP